jgi:hypothetical protein
MDFTRTQIRLFQCGVLFIDLEWVARCGVSFVPASAIVGTDGGQRIRRLPSTSVGRAYICRLRRPWEIWEILDTLAAVRGVERERPARHLIGAARKAAGYGIVYAQAEEAGPNGTAARPFAARFDKDRVFIALLSGAYDQWETSRVEVYCYPKSAGYAAASSTKRSGIAEISAR